MTPRRPPPTRPPLRAGATLALLGLLLHPAGPEGGPAGAQELPQAPFLTTPTGVVLGMLELVEVTPGDTVYDLGSGDGRIPIIAAGRFGARGVGVELQRRLVEEARENAVRAGVEDRVRFVHDDLFDVDLSPATVVTLYLLPSVNLRLRAKLLTELRPGARVVSNGFAMGDWEPDLDVRDLESHIVLYAWIVPANAAGRWRVTPPRGEPFTLELEQRYQELKASTAADGGGEGVGPESASAPPRVLEAGLRGRRITLVLDRPGGEREWRGTVRGDRMEGAVEGGGTWSAARISGGGQPLAPPGPPP